MTTIHNINGKYRAITKGAPDVLLDRCTRFYNNGNISDLSFSKRNSLKKRNEDLANRALRIIAVAYIDLDILPKNLDDNFIENNLIFVGFIGMIDPPREGVKESIKRHRSPFFSNSFFHWIDALGSASLLFEKICSTGFSPTMLCSSGFAEL